MARGTAQADHPTPARLALARSKTVCLNGKLRALRKDGNPSQRGRRRLSTRSLLAVRRAQKNTGPIVPLQIVKTWMYDGLRASNNDYAYVTRTSVVLMRAALESRLLALVRSAADVTDARKRRRMTAADCYTAIRIARVPL